MSTTGGFGLDPVGHRGNGEAPGTSQSYVAIDRDWRYVYVNDQALEHMRRLGPADLRRGDLIGKSVWEVFPQAVGTEMHRRYLTAMDDGGPAELGSYFGPSGEWIEVHAYPSSAGLEIYSREFSSGRAAESRRRQGDREQHLVAELGLRALDECELQDLLDDAVILLARTLEIELTGVAENLPGGGGLVLRAGVGWDPGSVGVATGAPAEGSLVGYTVETGEPVISEDLELDDRFEITPLLRQHNPRSAACVVIGGRDEGFGALGVFSRQRRTFSQREVDFLQAVANVLAGAVNRAENEQRMIEAREAERRRLARDLHDEALQELAHAQAAAARASPDSAESIVPALQRVGRHLRSAIYDLRLGAVQNLPFLELLESLVALHDDLDEDVAVKLELADGVPSGSLGRRGTQVLQVIGEALVNARRHADAASVIVEARGADGYLYVDVRDDGQGFEATAAARARWTGIAAMRERAATLGAELTVTGIPGSGTTVRLEVPLDAQGGAAELQILIVEDHAAVREAIAELLNGEPDLRVAGQASTLKEARAMLEGVDLAIIDLALPDGYGGDLIGELLQTNKHAQAVVLSAHLDRTEVARAVESGAAAVLDKSLHVNELIESVRRLRAGETLLSIEEVMELTSLIRRKREEERDERRAIAEITNREREILQCLAAGLSGQEIASHLHIALRTQRNHVSNILAKLGVHPASGPGARSAPRGGGDPLRGCVHPLGLAQR